MRLNDIVKARRISGATTGRYTCDYPESCADPVSGTAFRGLQQSGFTRHFSSAAPLNANYTTSAMPLEATPWNDLLRQL
jgi:hypothetical protein